MCKSGSNEAALTAEDGGSDMEEGAASGFGAIFLHGNSVLSEEEDPKRQQRAVVRMNSLIPWGQGRRECLVIDIRVILFSQNSSIGVTLFRIGIATSGRAWAAKVQKMAQLVCFAFSFDIFIFRCTAFDSQCIMVQLW